MKGTKLLTAIGLALALSAAGTVLASSHMTQSQGPKLPPSIQQALDQGATVTFVDADGNAVWTSTLGLEPRSDLLALAAKVIVYDASGNVVLELPVVLGNDNHPLIQTQNGTVEAEKFAKAMLQSPGMRSGFGEDSGRLEGSEHRGQDEASMREDSEHKKDDMDRSGSMRRGDDRRGHDESVRESRRQDDDHRGSMSERRGGDDHGKREHGENDD